MLRNTLKNACLSQCTYWIRLIKVHVDGSCALFLFLHCVCYIFYASIANWIRQRQRITFKLYWKNFVISVFFKPSIFVNGFIIFLIWFLIRFEPLLNSKNLWLGFRSSSFHCIIDLQRPFPYLMRLSKNRVCFGLSRLEALCVCISIGLSEAIDYSGSSIKKKHWH